MRTLRTSRQSAGRPTRRPRIPKGFVLVNLKGWEQAELRDLAKQCGVDLRTVFAWALTRTRESLVECAEIKRKTGIAPGAQFRFLAHNGGMN